MAAELRSFRGAERERGKRYDQDVKQRAIRWATERHVLDARLADLQFCFFECAHQALVLAVHPLRVDEQTEALLDYPPLRDVDKAVVRQLAACR